MKKAMYFVATIFILLSLAVLITLKQPMFGKLPSGERLERIRKSTNFRDGSFQNQSHTPVMAEDVSYLKVSREFFFNKVQELTPSGSIPSVKTDLLNLDINEDILVWFGHSSYFIQVDGKKILVDPVFSGHASPFSFSVKAFKGTDRYSAADIPEIDYLIITHDHWDHLDYETMIGFKPKIRKVICGLGVGENFERWGFDVPVLEMDWYERIDPDPGFSVFSVPARHFSGRGLRRNQTLWSSFLFQSPGMKIYIGGDSGYDKHFAEAGTKFGPIDLAILENGQYNRNWRYIHLLPDELLKAFKDLDAKRLFTVHNSKFALGNHPWDEPLKMANKGSRESGIDLLTPVIGEKVNLKDSTQKFSEWWQTVK